MTVREFIAELLDMANTLDDEMFVNVETDDDNKIALITGFHTYRNPYDRVEILCELDCKGSD